MITVFVMFQIMWGGFVLLIGIPKLYFMLGGSTGIYFLLPIIAVLSLKPKGYSKLIWPVIFSLASLVMLNYLYSYFAIENVFLNELIVTYVVMLPLIFVFCGIIFSIYYFIPYAKEGAYPDKAEEWTVRYFGGFIFGAMMVNIVFSCLVAAYLYLTYESIQIISLGLKMGLGSLIIGGLIVMWEVRRTPMETINYYCRPPERLSIDIGKYHGKIYAILLIILVFSIFFEVFYRKDWILWWETVAFFLILINIIFYFLNVISHPSPAINQKPPDTKLPSILSKRTMKIWGLLVVFYIFELIVLSTGIQRGLIGAQYN